MTRIVNGFGAALGSVALLTSAMIVQAQEQGTTTPAPADAPAGTAAPAPAPQTPPPAATSPAAPAPSTTTAPPAAVDAPAAPTAADAPKLPDVEIIQTQPAPAPEPDKPDAPPPPKIVKKKPPVAPEPQPVAVQAKPKTAPKPKPVPQAAPEPQPAPQQVVEPAPQLAELPPPAGGPAPADTLVKMSPVAGSEIPLEKVPGAVGTVSAADVARNGTGQVQNVLQQQVPGIILSDTAGSGFRTDVSYRGFDASPVGGRSQALAVYMNGIRINESFGDTVNFDAIPSIAISSMAVVGNNPVFGLNAIGGAISVSMKDGFEFQGATIDAMAGSFGRKQIAAEAGAKSGAFAAYAAAEYLEEDGFRDFSAAEVKRMFADVGFKGSDVELHFSFNGAKSLAGVVTAAPVELLALDYGRTFTSPAGHRI